MTRLILFANILGSKEVRKSHIATTRISPKRQITIPHQAFRELELEVGDYLEAEVRDETLVLKPKKLVPKEQAWFWSKEWQAKERQASDDIKEGRISGPFRSGKELIRSLKTKK